MILTADGKLKLNDQIQIDESIDKITKIKSTKN